MPTEVCKYKHSIKSHNMEWTHQEVLKSQEHAHMLSGERVRKTLKRDYIEGLSNHSAGLKQSCQCSP